MPQEQVVDYSTLWKKVLDDVRLEVSENTYTSFFKRTSVNKIVSDTLYINCQNNGVGFVLQSKYNNLILTAAKKYAGETLSRINYESMPTEKKKEDPGPLFVSRPASVDELILNSGISPHLSFDNFAVSVSNQMAQAAALTVANNLGTEYNPLFIWGGVGVGKTHLLAAIGRKAIETKRARVLYGSTEDFTNSLVEAIRNKKTDLFRKKYRNIDLLLLDDVQFISEREFVQEELFYTFNKLKSLNKQVVFVADKPPKFLKKIEKRLVSRFLSGLIVDIQPPDFELKTAIILIKGQERGLSLDIETAKLISSSMEEIREVEGFLLTLSVIKNSGGKITREFVEKKLLQNTAQRTFHLSPKEIIGAVLKETGIRLGEIKEDNRKKQVVMARHLIMYFLKTATSLPYEDIAHLLGKKDHTTVMHAVQKIITQVPHNESLRQRIENIKARLQ